LNSYQNSVVWVEQLKKINLLGLEKLDVGDVFCKGYYNYFFQGPFIFKKIDKNNIKHVQFLKMNKESNMLIQNLVPQVQLKLTDRDVREFKMTLLNKNKGQFYFEKNLEQLAKLHYYKLDINDLKFDKETVLYKNIVAPMTEFFKIIRSQNRYYLDFESYFEMTWTKFFGSRFMTSINKGLNTMEYNSIKITNYFKKKH
jgi:hypothetical protein